MLARLILPATLAVAYIASMAWLAWSLAQWQSWVGALVAVLGVLSIGYACLQSGWLDRRPEQPATPTANAHRNGAVELAKHASARNASLVEPPDSALD